MRLERSRWLLLLVAAAAAAVPNLVHAVGPIDLSVAEVMVEQGGTDRLVVSVLVDKTPGTGSDNVMSGPATLVVDLPDGASFVSGPNCGSAGSVVTCIVGPATDPVRLNRLLGGVFTIQIDPNNVPTASITGSVTSVDADPDTANNSFSTPLPPVVGFDLAIGDVTSTATAAQMVAVNIDVVNLGINSIGISAPATLTVALPAGSAFVDGQTCSALGATVTCLVGPQVEPIRLDHYVGGLFTVSIDPLSPPTSPMTGFVVGADPDPLLANNSFSALLVPGVDLAFESFVLRNAGFQQVQTASDLDPAGIAMRIVAPVRSVGVTTTLWFETAVIYVLPSGLQFVRGDGCTEVGPTVTCVIGPDHLAPGRPDTLVGDGISVTLAAGATTLGGPISATVQSGSTDPNSANNAATFALGVPAPTTTTPSPAVDVTSALPETGRETGPLAAIAGLMVAFGGLAVLAARRRSAY